MDLNLIILIILAICITVFCTSILYLGFEMAKPFPKKEAK